MNVAGKCMLMVRQGRDYDDYLLLKWRAIMMILGMHIRIRYVDSEMCTFKRKWVVVILWADT